MLQISTRLFWFEFLLYQSSSSQISSVRSKSFSNAKRKRGSPWAKINLDPFQLNSNCARRSKEQQIARIGICNFVDRRASPFEASTFEKKMELSRTPDGSRRATKGALSSFVESRGSVASLHNVWTNVWPKEAIKGSFLGMPAERIEAAFRGPLPQLW